MLSGAALLLAADEAAAAAYQVGSRWRERLTSRLFVVVPCLFVVVLAVVIVIVSELIVDLELERGSAAACDLGEEASLRSAVRVTRGTLQ